MCMSDEPTTEAPPLDYEPPPIPFGEPEEPGPDEADEVIPPPGEEDGGEDRPVEIMTGDARVTFISHEQNEVHRIGGTSAVRSFSVGEIRVKRAGSMNDDVNAVSIHRDTLGALHLLLSEDPVNVDAIRALLPPLGS